MARATVLTYVYFTWLSVWAVARFLFQDRWSWLFLINGLTFYLFVPLLFILPLAIQLRRRAIWLAFAAASLLWLALYGWIFLPDVANVRAEDGSVTVMTYNAMGYNENVAPVIDVIRDSGADIVGIGELNHQVASALQQSASDIYPYQILYPSNAVEGNGVISRFPLVETGERLAADDWIGDPIILQANVNGAPVTVVQFHAVALWRSPGKLGLEWSLRTREAQARAVAEFVRSHEDPVIVLSDLNATDQNEAYRIITATLSDSWRESGRGLGHTFPGVNSRFSSRPVILGIPAPKWMIRIDYIFHNAHFRSESAWLGKWDGLSDHRPVIARLAPTGGS
jgi:endonuclease/exonuclease/phosphatase (EEP) superfamily protein YafD